MKPAISPRPTSPTISALPSPRARRGAIGKALLVWLLSGSLGIAVIAYLIFAMMGC